MGMRRPAIGQWPPRHEHSLAPAPCLGGLNTTWWYHVETSVPSFAHSLIRARGDRGNGCGLHLISLLTWQAELGATNRAWMESRSNGSKCGVWPGIGSTEEGRSVSGMWPNSNSRFVRNPIITEILETMIPIAQEKCLGGINPATIQPNRMIFRSSNLPANIRLC